MKEEENDRLLEVFNKCYINLKDKPTSFELISTDDLTKLNEKVRLIYSSNGCGFVNIIIHKFLASSGVYLITYPSSTELLYTDKGYYNYSAVSIKNVGDAVLKYYEGAKLYKTLVYPDGDLATCLKLELLYDHYGKDIFSIDVNEKDEIDKISRYTSEGYHIPDIIKEEFDKIYFNRDFYIYYPWNNFTKDWIIRKGKFTSMGISGTYYFKDEKTKDLIYFGSASYSKNKWGIALNKEMLIEQLVSVKESRIKMLTNNITKSEKRIKNLEETLEKTRTNLEEQIYNYAFEEEKLNKILKDGETA